MWLNLLRCRKCLPPSRGADKGCWRQKELESCGCRGSSAEVCVQWLRMWLSWGKEVSHIRYRARKGSRAQAQPQGSVQLGQTHPFWTVSLSHPSCLSRTSTDAEHRGPEKSHLDVLNRLCWACSRCYSHRVPAVSGMKDGTKHTHLIRVGQTGAEGHTACVSITGHSANTGLRVLPVLTEGCHLCSPEPFVRSAGREGQGRVLAQVNVRGEERLMK